MKIKAFGKLTSMFIVLGMGFARADQTRDVNIYSFLTKAGEKLIPPTADHPATCLLINGGLHEEGSLVAGEKPPAPEKVEGFVKKALAAAHYNYVDLYAKNQPTKLDYIIVYYWGYMNPSIVESDTGEEERADSTRGDTGDASINPTVNFNGAAMIALVAGDSIDRIAPDTPSWRDVLEAAGENRYFVFIAAYSPAAYFMNNKHDRKLLWRAQMSLPSRGVTFNQSIGPLVDSSVAYLGRSTDLPTQVPENMDRPAHVIFGTPEVKEYIEPSKPTDTPKK